MTRIDKKRIRDELRKVLLIQADHLAITASEAVARNFIGLPLGEGDYYYSEMDNPPIDLERFHATYLLETCHDYAFTPSVLTGHDDSLVQDLQIFALGMPPCDAGGVIHDFLTDRGVCKTVAAASLARFKLDEGDDLTSHEVGLLANVTDGAVRNALSNKSEGGLRAIPGSKNPIMIENAEALRWLLGRRGFMPTPESISDDRFLEERIKHVRSTEEFGQILARLSWPCFGTPEKAPEKLGWQAARFEAWLAGTQEFNETEAQRLAEAFGVDVPLFVGKARETTLRRERASTGAAA